MKLLQNILKIVLPFLFALGILWWMYRGTDWQVFLSSVLHDMKWGWMLFSFVFGILAQLVRAWRWRMLLAPIGERARRRSCEDAVFVSYAASLVVPRSGEVLRCGLLKRADGVSFSKALGTVFTERVVDSLLIVLLTVVAFFWQVPAFKRFLDETGMDLRSFLGRFTETGYLVTITCIVAAVALVLTLVARYMKKGKKVLKNLWAGVSSLRKLKNLPLFLFWSLMIWACYFLHFYLAFFCFDFTANIPPAAAFLIFCISTFAVLVPTPNGAGPWHFAVKTSLVLYGVAAGNAILFALAVHTIQTGLVVVLGLWGWLSTTYLQKKRIQSNKTFNA